MQFRPTMEDLLPNWDDAKKHAQAVSTKRPLFTQGDQPVCKCCNNILQRQQVEVCSNKKSLSFLGFGVPLYYLFIKYCVVLVLLLIVTDGIVSIYQAYQTNSLSCQSYYTPHTTVNPLSKLRTITTPNASQTLMADQMALLCGSFYLRMASLQKKTGTPEILLRISAFIIHLVFLIYIKISLFHTGQYYNQITIDLADYSVIFRNLPTNVHNKRTIFHSIVSDIKNRDGDTLDYFDILIIPRQDQLEKMFKEKQHVKAEFLKIRETNQKKGEELFQQYLDKSDKIAQKLQQCRQEVIDDCIASENAIIVFNKEPDRIDLQEPQNAAFVQRKLKYYFGEGAKDITFQQAPGPKEIIWPNLKHQTNKKFRIFVGWGLSVLFLTLTLIVFYFINMFKANLIVSAEFDVVSNATTAATQTKAIMARVVAWATFIGIILYNKFVMGTVLHHLTDLEHHDDKSDYAFSFAFKYSLGMFFTTCLMTVTVEALVHHNYYSHPFGVIEQQSLMFVFSSILVPLIWLCNPYQLMHVRQRNKKQGSMKVTQNEANKLMADYQYSIGKRYAEIIQLMWFTYLYADLIPGGMFVVIFGLMAYYWVDKFNLLTRSSVTYNISADLSFRISDLIDWTLFWRFCGQVIFDYQLRGQVHTYTIVLVTLSLVYILLPMRKIVSLLAAQDFNPNYRHIKELWDTHFKYHNYRSTNPLYTNIVGGTGLKYTFSNIFEYFYRTE